MSNEHITDELVMGMAVKAGFGPIFTESSIDRLRSLVEQAAALRPAAQPAEQWETSPKDAEQWETSPMAAAQPVGEPVATVVSWTNGSYSRNYKLEWHRDVPEGTNLYTTPQPVAVPDRVPMSREDLKAFMDESGYGHVTAQEKADFINGFRSAEAHHRITPPSNQPTRTE